MKFLKENIVSILLIVVSVLVTLQLSSIFRKSPEVVNNKDEIKEVQKERDYYRGKYDSVIALARERDTVLVQQYIQLNDKIKTIRPAIISLDKQSTGAELDRYIMQTGSGN